MKSWVALSYEFPGFPGVRYHLAVSTPVIILANPYSGAGENRRKVDQLVERLAERGVGARAVWDPEQRRDVLADPLLDQHVRCIISAGGDGSLADVVNDLNRAGNLQGATLAMLPMGNENLVGVELGFDRGIASLADAVVAGKTRQIDLGQAGDRLWLLNTSAGFDAEVMHRLDHWRKAGEGLKRVGRANYLPRIFATLRRYKYPPITLEADGKTFRGAHVFVFNFALYGPRFKLAFETQCDDGQLDYLVFERPGILSHVRYMFAMGRGKHLKLPHVAHGRATHLRITGDVSLQIDGDPCHDPLPINLSVYPNALRVIDTSTLQ